MAIYLTFCAALVVAALLMTRPDRRRIEVGVLAWIGIFGLGSGAYYAGRSHSEVRVAIFSSWALAIVFLLVVTVRDLVRRGGRPSPAQVALFVGFGLLVCSLAQFPAPWRSIKRLETHSTETFQPSAEAEFVAANTKPGEPVVMLTVLSQRLSREAGVDNVTPYSAPNSMPTRLQLNETLARLHEAGGTKVFLDEAAAWPDFVPELEARGFHQVQVIEPARPTSGAPSDHFFLLAKP